MAKISVKLASGRVLGPVSFLEPWSPHAGVSWGFWCEVRHHERSFASGKCGVLAGTPYDRL